MTPTPRQYVLIVLAALSAFNFLDQQLMSNLLEPVRHEFALTDIQLGSQSRASPYQCASML